jgi:uncharacterized protein YodC (DUF2158 family)
MKTHEIKPGDVVRLKSDDDRMTVSEVKRDRASCMWRDGGKFHERLFWLVTLELVDMTNESPKSKPSQDAQ